MANLKDLKKLHDEMIENANRIDDALSVPVLTSTPYIVTLGGLPVDIEIKNNKTTGKSNIGNVLNVRRYSKENAEILAPGAENGHGEKGKVEFWKDVARREAKMFRETALLMAENFKKKWGVDLAV